MNLVEPTPLPEGAPSAGGPPWMVHSGKNGLGPATSMPGGYKGLVAESGSKMGTPPKKINGADRLYGRKFLGRWRTVY